MPTGLLDSCTVTQVVECLERGLAGQYPWSIRTVLDLTALLIREGHLGLAPGLAPPKSIVHDNQDLLIDLMRSNGLVASLPQIDSDTVHLAFTRSKKWIGRGEHLAALRDEVDRLMADKKDFQNWIDWSAPHAWHSYVSRSGGIFDTAYLAYVATILDISEREALDLHRRSADPGEISRLVAVRGQDFEHMTRAYVASAIMRGRYHEEVARLKNFQLVRHPLRGLISKTRTGRPVAEVRVPQAAWCLACIVLYGAVRQSHLRDRLRCWVDNVRKARGFLARGGLDLTDGTRDAAVDAAVLVARRAGIQIVDSQLDSLFEIIAGLGIGTLTAIFLNPWLGVPAGVGVRVGLKKVGFPHSFRNAVAFQTRRSKLEQVAAGRIETDWSKADN